MFVILPNGIRLDTKYIWAYEGVTDLNNCCVNINLLPEVGGGSIVCDCETIEEAQSCITQLDVIKGLRKPEQTEVDKDW